MNKENKRIRDEAMATPLSKLSRAYNPFTELTPLGNPLLPKGFVRENQFKNYRLRLVEDGEFMVDLHGNGGRVLSYPVNKLWRTPYGPIDSGKHWDDRITAQVNKFKNLRSMELILPLVKDDSRILQSASNSFRYALAERESLRSPNGFPTLTFTLNRHWNIWISSDKEHRRALLASAPWYKEDTMRELVGLFLDTKQLQVTFALKYPQLAAELAQAEGEEAKSKIEIKG